MPTLKHHMEVAQNFSECLFKWFLVLDLIFRRGNFIVCYDFVNTLREREVVRLKNYFNDINIYVPSKM